MTKKIILIITMLAVLAAFASAQQITRFAVVDTTVVYQTYFRESAAVRNYESMKAEFQTEITRLTDELKALQVKKIEAQKENDAAKVQRLEGEITKKASYHGISHTIKIFFHCTNIIKLIVIILSQMKSFFCSTNYPV